MSAPTSSRRQFLKAGSLATVGTVAALHASSVHAAGDDVIRVGDRRVRRVAGPGCGQALRADKNVKLVGMADAFSDRLELALQNLKAKRHR